MSMSFFNAFTPERGDLAVYRTFKQLEAAEQYACDHPLETALIVGSVVTLGTFFPAPVTLAVCLYTLVVLALNLFKDPTPIEQASGLLHSFTA